MDFASRFSQSLSSSVVILVLILHEQRHFVQPTGPRYTLGRIVWVMCVRMSSVSAAI